MMAYTVLEKIKIKLEPLQHKKRSYIAVYKGMVVYKGSGDHCNLRGWCYNWDIWMLSNIMSSSSKAYINYEHTYAPRI